MMSKVSKNIFGRHINKQNGKEAAKMPASFLMLSKCCSYHYEKTMN